MMNLFSNTFLVLNNPTLIDSFSLMIVGFGLVIFGLMVLALMTQLNGMVFSYIERRKKHPAADVLAASKPSIGELDGRILAVINAAAYTVCGRRVRVTQVKSESEGRWSQQGRHNLQYSHNVRSNKDGLNR